MNANLKMRIFDQNSRVVLTYPSCVQRAIWTSNVQEGLPVNDEISFQSSEGMRFNAGNASYQLTGSRATTPKRSTASNRRN